MNVCVIVYEVVHFSIGFKSLVLFLKKGAKEFVDQNMLRSQRSRKHRRQPRPHVSNCPGPSQSAEESKPGDSDHETTSSSGGNLFTWEISVSKVWRASHWWISGRLIWEYMYFYMRFVLYCFEILFISPRSWSNCKDIVMARLTQRYQGWRLGLGKSRVGMKHYLLYSHPHTAPFWKSPHHIWLKLSHSFMSGFLFSFSASSSQGKQSYHYSLFKPFSMLQHKCALSALLTACFLFF